MAESTGTKLRLEQRIKQMLSGILAVLLRGTVNLRDDCKNIYSHATLSSKIGGALPPSAVILGRTYVYGTRNIQIGENVLFQPHVHLETREAGRIEIGCDVVISRGVHIVAMAGVSIGEGSMIGEYSSIRDANHVRASDGRLRDAGYEARKITIGRQVWIGRGVAVLSGITIGDNATVGANAVVTHDVPAGATVMGIPAKAAEARG
jgi:acetyltransferase-like isoleucine patch superfamily enzyme